MDEKSLKLLQKSYGCSFSQFSDSFVFSASIENGNSRKPGYLPFVIAQFTQDAFDIGFLVRGGLAKGKMIHDNKGPVFGPAFIEAYELESRQAVFGRTVVSADAFSFLKTQERYATEFIEEGYDGVKETTIPSIINALYIHVKNERTTKLKNAITHLDKLKEKIPLRDKNLCFSKYNYIRSRLIESLSKIDD